MAAPEYWLVMLSLGVLSALFGFLPKFLLNNLKYFKDVTQGIVYQCTISALSCLGAGVLLSTTLGHMLPENRMRLEAIKFVQDTFGHHFPMAEVLTLVGFLLIYFLEEVANYMVAGQGVIPFHSHNSNKTQTNLENNHVRQPSITSINVMSPGTVHFENAEDALENLENFNNNSKSQLHESPIDLTRKVSQMGAFFAVFALSFHAIMEGVAIGIQNEDNLWLMFGAVASHKFVIAFCMGMELCAVEAKLKLYIGSVLLFAILSPAGILIGSLLNSESSTNSFPLGVLEGIATGTLVYVIFMEILSRERERRQNEISKSRFAGFLQLFAMIVGVIAMVCLFTMTAHGHSHDHGHHHNPGHGDCEHEDDYDHEHDHEH